MAFIKMWIFTVCRFGSVLDKPVRHCYDRAKENKQLTGDNENGTSRRENRKLRANAQPLKIELGRSAERPALKTMVSYH